MNLLSDEWPNVPGDNEKSVTQLDSPNALKSLMSGLIYPAFLGSALVWFLQNCTKTIETKSPIDLMTIETGYAIWLMVYFCLVFLLVLQKKPYTIWCFLLDITDVIIIFFCYSSLGLVSGGKANLTHFYIALLFIPIVALISLGRDRLLTWSNIRFVLSLVALAACILIISVDSETQVKLSFPIFALFIILLLFYTLDYVTRKNS